MRNYRRKGVRVKSEEPEGFTFGIPISLTVPVKVKTEDTKENQVHLATSGMQMSPSMGVTSYRQHGLQFGPASEYSDLALTREGPKIIKSHESAIRQEQLRQQQQRVREEEAHLAYLNQQEMLRREEVARQAWFREQERMRYEEEQRNAWLREHERIRSEEEGRQARIREQEVKM